jgi:hypothetical protein
MATDGDISRFGTGGIRLTPQQVAQFGVVTPSIATPSVTASQEPPSEALSQRNRTRTDTGTTGDLPTATPIENPLHEYASYTYNLSLHILSIDTYNQIINNNFVNDSPTPYVPENVIISGAGRYNDTDFKRNRNFKEDFYFEDFKMQTVITSTMRNRNTNLIECSFTIIEPNGFTLINRMIAAANEVNKNFVSAPESYARIPYVLQIDFFGYKDIDNAKPEKIQSLTKYIPICFTNVETHLRQSGAEYKMEAVAYNHQVFSQLMNAIPFNTTVQASTVSAAFNAGSGNDATVSEFYNRITNQRDVSREITQLQILRNQTIDTLNNIGFSDATAGNLQDIDTKLSSLTAQLNNLNNTNIESRGICSAFTDYFKALTKIGDINYPTAYRVEFDEEIGNSKLMPGPQPITPNSANSTTKPNSQLSYRSGVINVPAGTTIDKLIDFMLRHSSYIQDQLKVLGVDIKGNESVETLVNLAKQPLKWYKIVPTIQVGPWDNKVKRFSATTVVFYVRKFTVNSKYPYGPQGKTPGYVKIYDYMFTGRNRDVLDWNISFNTLYLLAVTGGLSKEIQGTTSPATNPAGQGAAPGNKLNTVVPSLPGADPVAQPGIAVIAGNNNSTVIDGGNIQKSTAASDLANSLLLGSRGDMIELDLKIIGDPHFIKQDDVFYSRPGKNQNAALTPNNSLYMDTGELYVFVNFLSPVDYNEEKGLAEIRANDILGYQNVAKSLGYSNFSGVYKLITVDSTFSHGKFEQNLRLVKVLTDQLGRNITTTVREDSSQAAIQPSETYVLGENVRLGRSTQNSPDSEYQVNNSVERILSDSASIPTPVIIDAGWTLDDGTLG